MTTTQHTPGPWSEDPEGEVAVSIEDANGNVVADVYGPAEDNPNARLIASAPELLELCEESLRALHEDDFPILKDKLRAAIAAATGEDK